MGIPSVGSSDEDEMEDDDDEDDDSEEELPDSPQVFHPLTVQRPTSWFHSMLIYPQTTLDGLTDISLHVVC